MTQAESKDGAGFAIGDKVWVEATIVEPWFGGYRVRLGVGGNLTTLAPDRIRPRAASPASVEIGDAGDSDAAFVERMAFWPAIIGTKHQSLVLTPELRRLVALARRAVTPPSTAAGGTDDEVTL